MTILCVWVCFEGMVGFFKGGWVHGKDLGVWIGCLPQDTTTTFVQVALVDYGICTT